MRHMIAFSIALVLITSCANNAKQKTKEMDGTFKTADWVAGTNIYEVNLRQYTPEGTFAAFEKELPRLKDMGVEVLWFMPITPIGKEKRLGTLGSYAGYSYAIPVNIVKKIVNDLIKFGTVQRAYLGISYPVENLTEEQKKEIGFKEGDGVFVSDAPAGGAANAAGIKKGDVVVKVNGVTVNSGPEMVEQVTRYKPGDRINVTYLRDGKENTVPLVLKNKGGNTDVVKSESILDKLGAQLETLDKKKAASYDLPGGVIVKKIGKGTLSQTKMQEGFVIASVNGTPIKTVDELKLALEANKGYTVKLEGIYPGYEGSYGYPLNLGGND